MKTDETLKVLKSIDASLKRLVEKLAPETPEEKATREKHRKGWTQAIKRGESLATSVSVAHGMVVNVDDGLLPAQLTGDEREAMNPRPVSQKAEPDVQPFRAEEMNVVKLTLTPEQLKAGGWR